VKRGVVEMVTPGIVMGENLVAGKENTFLASVYFGKSVTGVAFLDLSTGEFYIAEGDDIYVDKLISNLQPKEIVFQRGYEERFNDSFGAKHYTYRLDEWVFSENVNRDKLCSQLGVKSLKGFGIEAMTAGISAAGAILYYLEFTEHRQTAHISTIQRIDRNDAVWIDRFTIRNLELFASNSTTAKCSFTETIDRTLTAMGGRQLKRWVAMPLMDIAKIRMRQDIVAKFVEDGEFAEAMREQIALVGDLERIASRVATERVTPRELVQLKLALQAVEPIKKACEEATNPVLREIGARLDFCAEIRDRIAREIVPEPPLLLNKGGVVADGINETLDELRAISYNGKDYLLQIQQR
jgi:DNA mismatch repair protein MutS